MKTNNPPCDPKAILCDSLQALHEYLLYACKMAQPDYDIPSLANAISNMAETIRSLF